MTPRHEEFESEGYIVLPDFWKNGELDQLQQQLDALGRLVVGPEFSSRHYENYQLNSGLQSLLYDRLKYLPALACMSGSLAVQGICRELGLAHPSLMGCCNMRLDKPQDDKHLFAWHQDSLYLLGSENAVTVWVPFQDVNLQAGTIQVIPGSHKQGIYPFKKISDKVIVPYVPFLQRDLSLNYEITEKPISINASRGDVIIFKQMLLHRSTPNTSNQIRWTAQLRLTDLSDPDYRSQNFPTGDKTNIFYINYKNHCAEERRAQEINGNNI